MVFAHAQFFRIADLRARQNAEKSSIGPGTPENLIRSDPKREKKNEYEKKRPNKRARDVQELKKRRPRAKNEPT